MAIAQHDGLEIKASDLRTSDVTILLGYAAFAIALLIAVCLASTSGTVAADFAMMAVFP